MRLLTDRQTHTLNEVTICKSISQSLC